MNLTKVVVGANSGLVTLELPLVGITNSDEYICKQIDGLGPPEVDVRVKNTLHEGGIHRGRRPSGREIVMRVALTPNYATNKTAGDLRAYLYGLLSAGDLENPDYLDILLYEGTDLWAYTKGYVKRIEIVPFTKDPEVQITITCLSPYLVAPRVIVDPATMIPINNPVIFNPGTAPTGFILRITFTTPQPAGWWFRINNTKMEFGNGFDLGDDLLINTIPGKRTVTRYRYTTPVQTANLLAAITTTSKWPMFYGGANSIVFKNGQFQWSGAPGGGLYFDPNHWGI